MERKFKVGDRVKTGFYRTGEPILAEILSGLTVGGYTVYTIKTDDGFELQSEGVGFTLAPPPKLPEPKFNPYDKVRVNIKNFTPFNAEVTAWFICGDHYLYELKTEDGGTIQSKGEGVELIEPRYKHGDKVWDKKHKEILWFVRYNAANVYFAICNYAKSMIYAEKSIPLSDIEPYTGQDKPKEETVSYKYTGSILNEEDAKRYFDEEAIKWANGTSKPTHPYTAILKSGVKVGVSQGIAIAMIASMDSESCKRINDSEYFLHSEIAAIVPTENIVK